MFKVLFIAYYFPPKGLSGVQRSLKFVKYLPKYGWMPTVLTVGDTAYYAHDTSLLHEIPPEVRIVRVQGKDINSRLAKYKTVPIPNEKLRKLGRFLKSVVFIPDDKISWCTYAYKAAEKLMTEEDFDVIFVSAPPHSTITMATKLKERFQKPVIADYRDLWLGFQFAIYPTPMHRTAIKNLEYAALKKVDKLIVTNRRIKEKVMDMYRFMRHEDIDIISHGFDPDDIANAMAGARKDTTKMVITYSGLFYEFITPKYFLMAFKELAVEHPEIAGNIELHFLGFLRKENRKLIRKLGIQNFVREFGYLDHLQSLKKVAASDLLWLMVGNGRNADTISSSKLFEYFGTKKPVLGMLPEGALKVSLEEYGSAYITAPDNVGEIKRALIRAYQDYRLGKVPKPEEEVVEKYRRDFLTEQLAKHFQFLIKDRI